MGVSIGHPWVEYLPHPPCNATLGLQSGQIFLGFFGSL